MAIFPHDAPAAVLLLRIPWLYINTYWFYSSSCHHKEFHVFLQRECIVDFTPITIVHSWYPSHTHTPHTNIYIGTCTLDFVFSHISIHTYTEYSSITMSDSLNGKVDYLMGSQY